MKAIVSRRFGLRGLRLEEVPKPIPGDGEVLVRICATSLNFATLCRVTGRPFLVRLMSDGLWRPRYAIPGGELAGVVEAAGREAKRFKPGDEVFGDTCRAGYGASAEYLCCPEGALAKKPAALSFEEAAALPQSALVALQGLRAGGIGAGKKVLVYGASGGIGSLAVQIAKAFGARVTGLCSGRNAPLVMSLGADRVIDYTKEDFASGGESFDLILAVRGHRSLGDYVRALSADGCFVLVGGSWAQVLESMTRGPRFLAAAGKRFGRFTYAVSTDDLAFIAELVEAGRLKPVIDSIYPLADMAEAIRHYGDGHARGKVLVRIRDHGGVAPEKGETA